MHAARAFTLLELLITTSVTALLMLGVSSLFIAFLSSAHKSRISQTLREEGQAAMQQMTRQLRSAQGINLDCQTNEPQGSLSFTNEANELITFSENTDRLASASATRTSWLTSAHPNANDYLRNLSFRCFGASGEQKYIEISFTLAIDQVRPTTLEFRSGVVTRN